MTGKLILPGDISSDTPGHGTLEFDTERPETVEAARAMFHQLTQPTPGSGKRAWLGAKLTQGIDGEMIKEFDPAAGTIFFIAPLAGG